MLYIALGCCAADAITTYIGMRLFGTSIESNRELEWLAVRTGPLMACITWFCLESALVFASTLIEQEGTLAAVFGAAAIWNSFVLLKALILKRVKTREIQ
jgi:hypothetical protein